LPATAAKSTLKAAVITIFDLNLIAFEGFVFITEKLPFRDNLYK